MGVTGCFGHQSQGSGLAIAGMPYTVNTKKVDYQRVRRLASRRRKQAAASHNASPSTSASAATPHARNSHLRRALKSNPRAPTMPSKKRQKRLRKLARIAEGLNVDAAADKNAVNLMMVE